MAGMIKKILCVVVVYMVVTVPYYTQAITCTEVLRHIRPCVNQLIYGGRVTSNCCEGVKRLTEQVITSEDRNLACDCMSRSHRPYPGMKKENIVALPGKCGVKDMPWIVPGADCNKVNEK